MRRTFRLAALAAITWFVFGGLVPAMAADPFVGETRAIAPAEGVVLRAAPGGMAAQTGRIAGGRTVVVNEVRGAWIRVTEIATAGQPAATGWMPAVQTVTPQSSQPAVPRRITAGGAGSGQVRADMVSAAGRQFDGPTEKSYRANHRDIDAAYPAVDAMEIATGNIDPQGAVAFIREGRLGRQEQDWDRPPLLPPSPQPRGGGRQERRGGGGGGLGGLLGGLGEKLGGETGRRVGETVGAIAENVREYDEQMNKSFTPEQEYFLGRAVAANAIAKYGVEPNAGLRNYVRMVGDVLVRKSTRIPSTFGGYHFEVLNTDEVNGVSGPGGFILITRGAVLACQTEDELASVLAHEIAHVTGKHGEQTIRKGQKFQAGKKAFSSSVAQATGLDDSRFTGALLQLFEATIGAGIQASIQDGYGRDLEFHSDREGTFILLDVVYDHGAMRDYLRRIRGTTGHYDSTHAPPAARAQALDATIAQVGTTHPSVVETAKGRTPRLRAATSFRPR